MNDVELTRALERAELPNQNFRHASHLHVGWVYLQESNSADEAAQKMAATLRRFAAAVGHPEKYHETLTHFWMCLLARHRDSAPGRELSDIVRENPRLLEKDLPLQYYSRDRIFSAQARNSWVEPDLKPITEDAAPLGPSSSTCNPSHRVVSG